MFGLFNKSKINRKHKKAANALGSHIHQQIVKAMEVK